MPGVWLRPPLHLLTACLVMQLWATASQAGPPYLTDDPEPTDYRHYEIYAFTDGVHNRDGTAGDVGIDFNYGGGPDLQLTAVLPIEFDRSRAGGSPAALGNIQFAAKYRFRHQRDSGWDVALFPRVFLPSASSSVGERHAYLQLPLWFGRDFGHWSTFGGGGCEFNQAGNSRNSCFAGWVLTRQVLPTLQVGAEIFHQSADAIDQLDKTVLGAGVRRDLGEHAHLLAYASRGIQNRESGHQYAWYAAVLFTL